MRIACSCSYGDAPIALIMAPTRELACQIETEANKIGAPCGVRIRAIYGGVPRGEHIRSCREGVDILIATPGRLLDMAEYGQVRLSFPPPHPRGLVRHCSMLVG